MNPVVHQAPKGGGSTHGCVRYILGYAGTEKELDRQQAGEQLLELYAHADEMPDRGVGALIELARTRPSAVWCEGVTSLATAAFEIDSLAAANGRVKEPVLHMSVAFGTDGNISNSLMREAIRRLLEHAGMSGQPFVAAVHRDTDHQHAHLAVGMIDPRTMRAFDRTQLNNRLHKAARHVEIAMGLARDWGNYKIVDGPDGPIVIKTTRQERKKFRAEARAQRPARSFEKIEDFERTFDRYADRVVAPRIREALVRCDGRDERRTWNEAHRVAEVWGTRFERDEHGFLHLVEADREDGQPNGRVRCDAIELCEGNLNLPRYQDHATAQIEYIAYLQSDPGVVVRAVAQEESIFTQEDLDSFIGARVRDFDDFEHLRNVVMRSQDLVVLTTDADLPILTTRAAMADERVARAVAHELANAPDDLFDPSTMHDVIESMQRERQEVDVDFAFTVEQLAPLMHLDRRLVTIEGRSGSGKTTIMEAVRRCVDATRERNGGTREVVGLTLSQAAAERLEIEAGFRCINSARARVMEQRGEQVVPYNGIVVVDEAGMVDAPSMRAILERAKERNATVVAIGDRRQLSPIDRGNGFALLIEETSAAGRHYGIAEVRRQKAEWYRRAVVHFSDAIFESDEKAREKGIREAYELFDANGAVDWHETDAAAACASVESYVRYKRAGKQLVIIAENKELVRWINEQLRRELGFEGAKGARRYRTEYGERELAIGDRIVFLRNETKLGVCNGYVADVEKLERYKITARIGEGKRVSFDPRHYTAWDYGHAATTVHKSQGASLYGEEYLPTRGARAESAHVATSRGKEYVKIRLSRSHFADADDFIEHLAERAGTKRNIRNHQDMVDEQMRGERLRSEYERRRELADELPARKRYDAMVERVLNARRDAIAAVRTRYLPRVQAAKQIPDGVGRRQGILQVYKERGRDERCIIRKYTPITFDEFRSLEVREEAAARALMRTRAERHVAGRKRKSRRDPSVSEVALKLRVDLDAPELAVPVRLAAKGDLERYERTRADARSSGLGDIANTSLKPDVVDAATKKSLANRVRALATIVRSVSRYFENHMATLRTLNRERTRGQGR